MNWKKNYILDNKLNMFPQSGPQKYMAVGPSGPYALCPPFPLVVTPLAIARRTWNNTKQ